VEARQPEQRYSWRDYLGWPADERFELVDGAPYAMSPAPRRRHQEIGGALFSQLYTALKESGCHVFIAPFDVKLSPDEMDEAPTVVQPDITVTCDDSKLTEQGMSGAPDLIIEIVSPDSGLADRGRKFDLYRRYGVREYWIADQEEQLVEVYLLTPEKEYRRAGVYGPTQTLSCSVVDNVNVDLSEVFRG
jgi:Uma2 family endonuclease